MVSAALNEVFEEKRFVVSRLSRKACPASKRQKGTQSCLEYVERKTKKILLAKGWNRRKRPLVARVIIFPVLANDGCVKENVVPVRVRKSGSRSRVTKENAPLKIRSLADKLHVMREGDVVYICSVIGDRPLCHAVNRRWDPLN